MLVVTNGVRINWAYGTGTSTKFVVLVSSSNIRILVICSTKNPIEVLMLQF